MLTEKCTICLWMPTWSQCTCSSSWQIFFAYVKQNAKPAQTSSEDGKGLSGRAAVPQSHLRQGPLLSWAGFEAICQVFHITTSPISTAVGPDPRHPPPPAHHHHAHHQPIRGAPLSNHPLSKAKPGAPGSKMTRQPDSPTRGFSGETPSRGLLSGAQVCIAFVSACSHSSMVASFPNDGKSDGVVSGESARRHKMFYAGSSEENERTSCAENDAAYWRVSCFCDYA